MTAYYNENDPKAAAWLRELIHQGHIAHGEVDERSIEDVTPLDVAGYTQCHFFAGIGGWSYALRLADWPDTRRIWTGSCPCQPFSAAGKGGGFDDARHLWPHWHHLITECKPPIIFGEQVASKDGLNWFDLVHSDLEGAHYAVGVADLCAAGVGAPHIRQRLYFVAESSGQRLERQRLHLQPRQSQLHLAETWRRGEAGDLAESASEQSHGDRNARRERGELADDGIVGDTDDAGSQRRIELRHGAGQLSPWAAELVDCRDGKRRPIEPGSFPLAHGVSHRVGLLRGYGNAIVAPLAAAFIKAYLDV